MIFAIKLYWYDSLISRSKEIEASMDKIQDELDQPWAVSGSFYANRLELIHTTYDIGRTICQVFADSIDPYK